MKNLLNSIDWPTAHLEHKGVQRWTSVHADPPRAFVASAFQKNEGIELRVRSTSMQGDKESMSYSHWERQGDEFVLTTREGQGQIKPLDEAAALREFQDYVVLIDTRPQFQMMGVLKTKPLPSPH